MRTLSITTAGIAALALAAAGCGGSGSSGSSGGSGSGGGSSSGSSSSGGGAGYGYGARSQSSSNAASTSAAGTVKVSADPNGGLTFTKKKLTAKAGTVTLDMSNPSSSGLAHGIGVEGNGLDKDGPVVQAGQTAKLTVKLKPGTYEFYCPVPSHKAAGMKGTLVVS
jgi:uncharacterized cupredoxin-like copper-binding protein